MIGHNARRIEVDVQNCWDNKDNQISFSKQGSTSTSTDCCIFLFFKREKSLSNQPKHQYQDYTIEESITDVYFDATQKIFQQKIYIDECEIRPVTDPFSYQSRILFFSHKYKSWIVRATSPLAVSSTVRQLLLRAQLNTLCLDLMRLFEFVTVDNFFLEIIFYMRGNSNYTLNTANNIVLIVQTGTD